MTMTTHERQIVGAATIDAPLLGLPEPGDLSAAQLCGEICIWGGESLSAATAVDLGPRTTVLPGGQRIQWFPRCCVSCIQAADRSHNGMCETCVETPGACETAAALRQLVREHAR
jgi:hypothetical protein